MASNMSTWSSLQLTASSQWVGVQPEPAERELPKEIVAEPITGLRVWKLASQDAVTLDRERLRSLADAWDRGENPFRSLLLTRLASVGVQHEWEREQEARCVYHKHAAPHNGCSCGIWAVRSEEYLDEVLLAYRQHMPFFYGQVLLWGRVVEHDKGWRAQHARVVGPLTSIGDVSAETRAEIVERYRCEVIEGDTPSVFKRMDEQQARTFQEQMDYQQKLMEQYLRKPAMQNPWGTPQTHPSGLNSPATPWLTWNKPPKRRWWQI